MKSRAVLEETLASRKVLFSALLSQGRNADKARAELAERRARLEADEKALADSLRVLPTKLAAIHADIERLENALVDPADRLIEAIFAR